LGSVLPQGRGKEPKLRGYSGSDLAGDINGRKSTTGLIFFLGDSAVCWQSAKQRIVAMSTYEAEYIAAATTSCQAVWLARLISEILNKEIGRPVLNIDNKSTISLIRNPVLNERSRHIDTRFHLTGNMKQMDRSVLVSLELKISSGISSPRHSAGSSIRSYASILDSTL
jgi:hypothetical protein